MQDEAFDKHPLAFAAQAEVPADQLRRRVDPALLPSSTADISPLEGTFGQPRALDAITFGLEMRSPGYHLFVAGPTGSGRERTVHDFLQRFAPGRPASSDWVYVYNFDQPDRPHALRMPQGQGRKLAADMDSLIEAAQRDIPRAFESEDYARRRSAALAELQTQQNALLDQLQSEARDQGFAIEMTASRIATIPLSHGKPISAEEFGRLPEARQQQLEQHMSALQEHLAATLRQVRQMQKQRIERVRQLECDVALFTVGPHLDELRETYAALPQVLAYLDQVRGDLPEHLDDFLGSESDGESGQQLLLGLLPGKPREERLARYRINVFVDNDASPGAPIVVERNPTYYNLVGRVDYRATFGALVTNFRQIKPGALQRANGGFLVLKALDLLSAPFAWEALKRALIGHEVTIENLGEQYSSLPTDHLKPEPIPLDVKVILLGSPQVYTLLYQLDPDFPELFKVKADFAPDMDWNEDHQQCYLTFIGQRVREEGLRHFDRAALARLIEEGARASEDQRRLSSRLRDIADVIAEANYWADKAGHDLVQAADVEQAIARRKYRANLMEERIQEMIAQGTLMIDTSGARCAQVNGMAVVESGSYAFGLPSRITARVSPGRGSVLSIEREIKLSGPIHAKGVLILSGYLAGQYAQQSLLSIAATITFEQSYDEVEGDSASSTELYALLSALSGLPLRQGVAVTGSVNQHGEVQAVGGVTAKIEGFFAVCKARGLTGEQGVLIPAANVLNLMLDEEVIEAVRAGQFHVWAVRTIDEGIELLTGRAAGQRAEEGQYPEGSVHRLVEERVRSFAERLRTFDADQQDKVGRDHHATSS
jgi:lon-related putative ATP-dependent protease